MNLKTSTKTLALIIIFSALAIALNLYGPKIPFPLADFLYFQIWEIPIVVAFLLIGPKTGLAVAGLNTIVLFMFFQGGLPAGPIYNLTAALAMMLGIYLPYKLATWNKKENKTNYLKKHILIITLAATALGAILRVAVMSVVNYFALPQSPPFGYELGEPVVMALIPVMAIFNAIIAAYTIPVSMAVTAAIENRVKVKN